MQLGFSRAIVRDPRNHRNDDDSVYHGSVHLPAVAGHELKSLCEDRRNHYAQQEQKTDVSQSAIESEQHYSQFGQSPTTRAQQRADQQENQQDDDKLAARVVEVDGNPFRNMLDIELLPKGEIERIEHQADAKRIHEQGAQTGAPAHEQLIALGGCPGIGRNQTPFSLEQACSDHGRKDHDPDKPGSVSVHPQAEERRNQPERRVALLAEALQDNQQQYEISVTKQNRAWAKRNRAEKNREASRHNGSFVVAALPVAEMQYSQEN